MHPQLDPWASLNGAPGRQVRILGEERTHRILLAAPRDHEQWLRDPGEKIRRHAHRGQPVWALDRDREAATGPLDTGDGEARGGVAVRAEPKEPEPEAHAGLQERGE